MNGIVPNNDRHVHPHIADAGPNLIPYASPHMAFADGQWNHGESLSGADTGGWHDNDDGTSVTLADVHTAPLNLCNWVPWSTYSWTDPLPPFASTPVRRYVGYLRPAALPTLPPTHPIYGTVGAYVDQGAFEVFTPLSLPAAGQKILLCIMCRETVQFPPDYLDKVVQWKQVYRGIFSPDGLVRPEAPVRTVAGFQGNTDPDAVDRPTLSLIQSWLSLPQADYWPILAYPVLSVMHRSTTLNEQRHLQLTQAVKEMLTATDSRNPIAPQAPLTPAQVEDRVVVCFVGGSNGGHQVHWSTLNFPNIVHGCYAEVISPSIQRLFGEHDLGHIFSRRGGFKFFGATVGESDFCVWDQYTWAKGLETNDLSYPRLFAAGRSGRPACFVVGDEDITSTGTDWVSVVNGAFWIDRGRLSNPWSFGDPTANTFSWMVAPAVCHSEALVPTNDPYTGQLNQWGGRNAAHGLFQDAVDHRIAELAAPIGPIPAANPDPHDQMRGLDDPQEWWLGRAGDALPAVTGSEPLQRDDVWFDSVNPDTAGSIPGGEGAMIIHGGRVYVGCTEGVVSAFQVASAAPLRQQLEKVASSAVLGNDVYSLAVDSSGQGALIVGTRRHLYRLRLDTLATMSGPVQLPWEVAQPRHMQVGDLLPSVPGNEVVFHSVHGGLVFYNAATLAPVFEWPEPGIVDFVIEGESVVILSSRGVVAKVTFPVTGGVVHPILEAVSKSVPTDYNLESCQGSPGDMALMLMNWGVARSFVVLSTWQGDIYGNEVRFHALADLFQLPANIALASQIKDIASCSMPSGYMGIAGPGDHALVLSNGRLKLYNQFGQLQGDLDLTTSIGAMPYGFGAGAHSIVVGELGVSGGGSYDEEIVVATNQGLMWLHVSDIATGPLPANYEVQTTAAGKLQTEIQPHTNRSFAAAWAMVPVDVGSETEIHMMDQRGNYWKVRHDGTIELFDCIKAYGTKDWQWVGNPTSSFDPAASPVFPYSHPQSVLGGMYPWCPVKTDKAIYDRRPGGGWFPSNWAVRPSPTIYFYGFALNSDSGATVDIGSGQVEMWCWKNMPSIDLGSAANPTSVGPWGNHIEGLRLGSVQGQHSVLGVWHSEGVPTTNPVVINGIERRENNEYLLMRSRDDASPIMASQSIKAVLLSSGANAGKPAIVLGCPGGKVMAHIPGAMQDSAAAVHQLGGVPDESGDVGFGGMALDVRMETWTDPGTEVTTDVIRIWFGTCCDPPPQPASYGNALGAGSLTDAEVMSGAIYLMEWRPGSPISILLKRDLKPSAANPRGASAVVGLKVGDILQSADCPGDELVVTTLSGDIIVYNADSMQEIWRTHITGSAGMYNAILIEDLDHDGTNELYVAGSWGLWRFNQ